jgi:peptidoglycan hydrolase-like protein with peptidoglycan-binding domain
MSRQTIVDVAAAENGTRESPPNSNRTKYGQWYGLDGVKWCAIFVSYVYHHAGHPLEQIDNRKGYQSCQSGFNFWRNKRRIVRDPQAGDIVLFDWTGSGVCNHTGIFVKWTDAERMKFLSWEGNTAVGNDSDGGQVMLRERKRSLVRAFVTPLALNDGNIDGVDGHEILKSGDSGARVAELQKLLFELKTDGVVVNGVFDRRTETAVKKFQRQHRLAVTGIVTPEVFGVIEEEAVSPKIDGARFISGSFIKKGDAGEAVLFVQKKLNKKGAEPPLVENGIFNADTLKAVKIFQRQNGLQVDGIVGPKTFGALNRKAVLI